MTITAIRPGCFGSAILFNVDATECSGCPLKVECQPAALKSQIAALVTVTTLDKVFRSERAQDVQKWFARSQVRNVTRERSTKRKTDFLAMLSANDVNVYHLKHRRNPVEEPGSLLHDTFAFMIEAEHFKVRELVEYLRPRHNLAKAPCEKHVKDVVEALEHAAILRKEKHVLCLV